MNPIPTLLAAAIAGLLTACSSSRPQVWSGAPSAVRERLGTVGVRLDYAHSRNFVFDEPDSKGSSARDMAGMGIHANLEGASGAGQAGGFVLVLMPAFALGGAIYGSVAGVSATKLHQALDAMTNASPRCDLVGALPEQIVSQAWSRGFDVLDASTGRTNFDTLLTARVVTQQLTGNESPNPALLLHYLVQVRVTDPSGRMLYDTYVETKSRRRSFVEWAEDGARRLREETSRRQDEIAAKIVSRVFLGEDSP